MSKRIKDFSRRWLPALLWMFFIFILSSVPSSHVPEFQVPFYHKTVHFFEYTILGALWLRALTYGRPSVGLWRFPVLAWALTAIFAFSDEWHQTFVPGRSGTLSDVHFDVICAVIGIAVYLIGLRSFQEGKSTLASKSGSAIRSGE